MQEQISEKLQLENARLNEELEKFKDYYEHSPDMFVSVNPETAKVYECNETLVQKLGYSAKSDVIGLNLHSLYHESCHDEFKKAFQTFKETGSVVNWRLDLRKSDGSKLPVLLNVTAVRNEDGSIVRSRSSWTDISKQQELVEAKDRAVALTHLKSQFLANMSHEVRTPLNGILGMISLLAETELTPEQEEMVTTIRNCGNGLLTVLNDILDYSKIESGKLEIENRDFEIVRCVHEIVALHSHLAQEKGIRIESQIHPSLPDIVFGDETRVRQVLLNLVSNAVKFTSEGRVSVLVNPSADGKYIEFLVQDSGVGIGEEYQSRLFECFTQADASVTRRFGGTGLGLTICAKLSELMGARLSFKSELGVGSAFTFHLPLRERTDEVSPSQGASAEELATASDPNLSLLLVEDNAVNQSIAVRMLKGLGYGCDVANNGEVALQMAQEKDYQLILMDIQMPVMDGLTATQKILELGRPVRPRVVAMTANVFEEDKARCWEAGMVDFVTKPVEKAALRRVIRAVRESEESAHFSGRPSQDGTHKNSSRKRFRKKLSS